MYVTICFFMSIQNTCFIGEIGLGGELRPVQQLSRRIQVGKRAIGLSCAANLEVEFVALSRTSRHKISVGTHAFQWPPSIRVHT